MTSISKKISVLIVLASLSACATKDVIQSNRYEDITIFSINDFHGNLQAEQPVPYVASKPDAQHAGQMVSVPAGG
ncbi:hypothetical protein [Undibacterium sp. RuRC25W]|uniref:hypothetical protein n=1 Tax=Undibacterium sp. RuRC25W TaxID=3413047 RepID=UPI003BF1E705